jgi:acetyl-CoA carboxylase alpha subunit
VIAARTTKPSSRQLLADMAEQYFEIHGDRVSGDDPAVMACIARIAGRPVFVVGHNSPVSDNVVGKITADFQMPHPSGYRKALRLVSIARRLKLPILTFIDSPGTFPDVESEAENQPGILGELTGAMLQAEVPTIGVILGEAIGSGALPFMTVDRLFMADTAYCSPICPEAASAILLGDVLHAEDAAELLKVSSGEMQAAGIADMRISGRISGRDLAQVVAAELQEISSKPEGCRRLRV